RWHLLRLGELRGQLVEQHPRGQATHREPGGAEQEAAPVDHAVNVSVEEVQQILRIVTRSLAFHRSSARSGLLKLYTRGRLPVIAIPAIARVVQGVHCASAVRSPSTRRM